MPWITVATLEALPDTSAAALARNPGSAFNRALADVFGGVVAGKVVAGGTVSVTEGGAWAASVTVENGVARFNFTVPPGGTAWSKGALTTSTVLDTLPEGEYQVASGSVATALGLPVVRVGRLVVHNVSSSLRRMEFLTNDQNSTSPLQIWARAMNSSGVWQPWRRPYPDDKAYLQWGALSGTENLATLEQGTYWVSAGSAATALGLPVVRIGRIDIHHNAANGQRDIVFTTNDVNAGAPLEIWGKATDQAGTLGAWRRIYPVTLPASTGTATPRGALLLEDLYAKHGGPIKTNGAVPVALTFDDYPRAYRDVVRPLLTARGLKATLGLGSKQYDPSSSRIYDGATGTTWAEIDGWVETEIANHGATHAYVGDDTLALHAEIVQGFRDLQAALPSKTITSWLQPSSGYGPFADGGSVGAWADSTAGQMIFANHAIATGTRSINGKLHAPRTGKPVNGLARHWFDSTGGPSAAQAAIAAARTAGAGLILASHPDRYGLPDRITVAEFAAFLDWLAAEQAAGRIRVMTLAEWAIADQRVSA